ncbi:hypothetical protein HY494_01820, partial [Candidatus Woesearchaeota archaeon]|nr:hypothetical protein [Candidatus Woesearchaeota archaeon]
FGTYHPPQKKRKMYLYLYHPFSIQYRLNDAFKYDLLKQGKYAFLFVQLKENSQVGYEEPGGPWPLSEEILHPPSTGSILTKMFNEDRESKGMSEFYSWRSRVYNAIRPDKLTLLVHDTTYRFAMPEIEVVEQVKK